MMHSKPDALAKLYILCNRHFPSKAAHAARLAARSIEMENGAIVTTSTRPPGRAAVEYGERLNVHSIRSAPFSLSLSRALGSNKRSMPVRSIKNNSVHATVGDEVRQRGEPVPYLRLPQLGHSISQPTFSSASVGLRKPSDCMRSVTRTLMSTRDRGST